MEEDRWAKVLRFVLRFIIILWMIGCVVQKAR